MATTHYNAHLGLNLVDRARVFFEGVQHDLELRAQYKTTVAELKALDDRELNDLGIARANITTIARETIYGA